MFHFHDINIITTEHPNQLCLYHRKMLLFAAFAETQPRSISVGVEGTKQQRQGRNRQVSNFPKTLI